MIKSTNSQKFSVKDDNPFLIFTYLQAEALKHFEENELLDLSRGNPGFGFCPAKQSREFFGFLQIMDTVLNSNFSGFRIHNQSEKDLPKIREMIENQAKNNFLPEIAQEHLETLEKITKKIQKFAQEEGKNWSELDVLKGIFAYSSLAGGTYPEPQGEVVTRIVTAGHHRQLMQDSGLSSEDFVLTLGVNDAIGTLFKMLGEEGLGYLKKGDTVAISSPAYSPYFNEINSRGLIPVEVGFDVEEGASDFRRLRETKDRIKAFFIINPNNPTGLQYDEAAMREMVEIAEENDSLIISDEIYAEFHSQFFSPYFYGKKRTICLSGRSKIERGPGLRFGDVIISKETNQFLTEFFASDLKAPDFLTEFIWMKGPGGTFGSFQHTAAVPGPSQVLGMLYVLLGDEERQKYVEMVDQNMDQFFEALGLPRNNSLYYGIFDLNSVPGNIRQDVAIEQKLLELAAEKGVILVPAMKFFSNAAQDESDKSNFVRVSLPNLPPEKVAEAGKRIRDYVCGE